MCYITSIDPIDSPLFKMAPKVRATGMTHSWMDQQIGWWWRHPYSWWLSLKRRFK